MAKCACSQCGNHIEFPVEVAGQFVHCPHCQGATQLNLEARATLARRGLAFNDADAAPFRARLSGVYAAWKERLGTRCWELLDESTKFKG